MPRRPLRLSELEQESIKKALHQSADAATRTILRALLHLAEGNSRQQTAEEAEVHPVTVTRWVRRFREQGLEGLAQDVPQGRPLKLNPKQLEALNQIARTPPRSLGKHFRRWNRQRLARHFSQQAGSAVGAQYVGQQLRKMGLLRVVSGSQEPSGVSQDSGFHPIPKTALIWVTVASLSHQRKHASDPRILFAGFNLASGGLTTHPAHQKRLAEFIEFLKSLSTAYPRQRVLAIIESGAIRISRTIGEYLDSESGRLELVFHPPEHNKLRRSSGKLDAERRDGEVSFLFGSPEKVIQNLRKDITNLKKWLAKETDFSSVLLGKGGG
jgi:transposase